MNNDLISRKELKKAIETYDKFACLPDGELMPFRELNVPEKDYEPYVHLRDIRNAIDNAPTVEQPTGKWIDNQNNSGGGINCSICGKMLPCTDEYWYETDYCPNCGAKMKGEEE